MSSQDKVREILMSFAHRVGDDWEGRVYADRRVAEENLNQALSQLNALNKIDEDRIQPNAKVRKKCHCDREEKTCSNCGGWY